MEIGRREGQMGCEGGRNSTAKEEEEHLTFILLLCF